MSSDSTKTRGNTAMHVLENHFKKLSSATTNNATFNTESVNHLSNAFIHNSFSLDKINRAVKKLKNNKACGID
jgi:hypothetical protein